MKIKNSKIYNMAQDIAIFTQEDFFFPVKANFAISKNIKTLTDLASIIEDERIRVVRHYGEPQDDNSYLIPNDKINEVQEKLDELLNIEQEVDIMTIPLDLLGDTKISTKQMQSLLFMIEE